jgi:hypothetical protein
VLRDDRAGPPEEGCDSGTGGCVVVPRGLLGAAGRTTLKGGVALGSGEGVRCVSSSVRGRGGRKPGSTSWNLRMGPLLEVCSVSVSVSDPEPEFEPVSGSSASSSSSSSSESRSVSVSAKG